jgi:beta-phosphoglucomutase
MSTVLGVIFDMDGVLVDSYHPHRQSWQEMARVEGLAMTDEQFAAGFGKTSREIIAEQWPQRHYSEEKIREVDRAKEAAYRQIIAVDFPAMDGAVELLQALKSAGYRLAVGSSGPPENIDLCLERLGQRALFDAVVTGADVRRGKPDPQVFVLAAERMGIAPSCCVVVEDAAIGVQAAHAAGTQAIGLASTGRTRESLAEAELVVDSLRELTPERIRGVILAGRPN